MPEPSSLLRSYSLLTPNSTDNILLKLLQAPPPLLNGCVTLALYLLATLLIIVSSMILYLYGHGRLGAQLRDRKLITMKGSDVWSYFAHCASFCFVLALSVVKAPLMHDLSTTYKGSLDGAVLAAGKHIN